MTKFKPKKRTFADELPTNAALADLSEEEVLAKLKDPKARAEFKAECLQALEELQQMIALVKAQRN